MDDKKTKLGQFFTKKSSWLTPQVEDFILNSKCKIAYDPFAGNGDLLEISKNIGFKKTVGLDIDTNLKWKINDSLKKIPKIKNSIIITNPPYISKSSATRKKIDLSDYFNDTNYEDLYLLALDKMLASQKKVVAIVPESFINSSFERKNLINSITILEENPFIDTEVPVCVICFDGINKSENEIKIYKNNSYVSTLKEINQLRIEPKNNLKISFNSKKGWLALRAVDSTDDEIVIKFSKKDDLKYDWDSKIKVSSRHITLIDINIPKDKIDHFVKLSNEILNQLREKSSDILLTPFMGNTKKGKRRRRLDYRLARAILEKANEEIVKNNFYYFEYSRKNNDEFLDFSKPNGEIVISNSLKEEKTNLMKENQNLLDLITTYSTLNKLGFENSLTKRTIILRIIEIIENVKQINYSPFCQYFQVLTFSYASYNRKKELLTEDQKIKLIGEIVEKYIENRHQCYLLHGYSDVILQVLSDSSSSRRRGVTGINKLINILNQFKFISVDNIDDFNSEKMCYFFPDKGDIKLFNDFLNNKKISFNFRKKRQNKNPDLVFKINNDFFIVEHKLTNGNGGAQNMDINEIIDFIRETEEVDNIHYLSCLQGDFFNNLKNKNKEMKNTFQYKDIVEALHKNSNNFFVNGKGLEQLLKDLIE